MMWVNKMLQLLTNSDVKTTKLDQLKDGGLTITFTATHVNIQGAKVNVPKSDYIVYTITSTGTADVYL